MTSYKPPIGNLPIFDPSVFNIDLENEVNTLEGEVNILKTKTQNITATTTTTTISSSASTNITGGLLNLTSNTNNLNITSTGNDINLNVPNGRAVYANTNLLFVGSGAPYNGFYSNIRMRNDTNTDWETQSRAFTEPLRTQISTNASNITTLQTKTQNITANTNSTSTNKRLILNNSGEVLEMTGTHSYIAGYDETNQTRDFIMGTPFPGDKNLTLSIEKIGDLVLSSGTDGASSNPTVYGRTKIKTYSKGFQFYRKQAYTPNPFLPTTIIDVYGGEIGLLGNDNDKTLYIKNNETDGIYMSSGAGVMNLVSSNIIYLSSNNVRVGSGTINQSTNFYSNLYFLDAGGNNWIPQSSAFTETLKSSILSSQNAINNGKSQIIKQNTFSGNSNILGRTNVLSPSTNYSTTTKLFDLGILLNNNGYTTYFNSLGEWIYNGGATQRVSIQYDINFLGLSTGIKAMVSRILINTAGGAAVEQSMPMGVRYSAGGGNPLNTNLYYSTGQFVTDLQSGYRINLETENFFSTSSDGASVTTTGRLTFYLLPY